MSKNSFLRHFSAQVSQIVFLAYLTVLRYYYNLYDLKCQKTHILHDFSAQVSQIVFLAYLTVLRLFTTVWLEMSENSLSPTISVHKYHKSCF